MCKKILYHSYSLSHCFIFPREILGDRSDSFLNNFQSFDRFSTKPITNIMGTHHIKSQLYVVTCLEGIMVLLKNLLVLRHKLPDIFPVFQQILRLYLGKLNKLKKFH